jgi:hypothetical protein
MPYHTSMTTSLVALGDHFRVAYGQAVRDLDAIRLRQWQRWQATLPQLRGLLQLQRGPGITTIERAEYAVEPLRLSDARPVVQR